MNCRIVLLIVLILVQTVQIAQSQSTLDSLGALLEKSRRNSNDQVNMLILMSRELQDKSKERALLYAQQALLTSERLNYLRGMADALYYIALSYEGLDNYAKALNYYAKSLKFYNNARNFPGEAIALKTIGQLHFSFGDYSQALDYFLRSLEIFERLNDSTGIASSYLNIGLSYYTNQDYIKALDNYQKALEIAQSQKALILIGDIYDAIADAQKARKNYAQAREYHQQAITLFLRLDNQRRLGRAYYGIGTVYKEIGRENDALASYLRAKQIQEEIKDNPGLSNSYMGISDVYLASGNTQRAIDYLNFSLALVKELNNKELAKSNYERLSQAYEVAGNLDKSLEYHKLFKAYNDSIYNQYKLALVAGLQTRFQLKDSEREIRTKQQRIDILTQMSVEQGRSIQIKDDDIHKQSIIIIASVIVIILTVILVIVLYRAHQRDLRANAMLRSRNEKIKKQNQEIEEKNKQLFEAFLKISDSIRYAETVQKAILPDESKLNDLLNEYFVISRAKEIVSGDFYWVSKLGDKTLLAVVDCTGHGVSGGFTSMIGHTLLNEIINQHQIDEPSTILELLNKGITSVIENQFQDIAIGMEACLVVIEPIPDKKEHVKISYAGAKRPLYSIKQNGIPGHKVEELRGDRQPIGLVLDNDRTYTTHEIVIHKGSLLYLTSDGFIDQANPNNKRFGTPRLKKILLENSAKSLSEQKLLLEKMLEEHQKDASQRDDITILGVKV